MTKIGRQRDDPDDGSSGEQTGSRDGGLTPVPTSRCSRVHRFERDRLGGEAFESAQRVAQVGLVGVHAGHDSFVRGEGGAGTPTGAGSLTRGDGAIPARSLASAREVEPLTVPTEQPSTAAVDFSSRSS